MIIVFWFLMTRQIGLTRQAWAHKARLGSQGTAWAITKNKIAKKQNREKQKSQKNERLAYTKRSFFWPAIFEPWSMREILNLASQLHPPTSVSST